MVKDTAATARKKKYVRPTLRAHGTLRNLTQGPGGSQQADGMFGMSMA